MGWNNYNFFVDNFTETTFVNQGEAIVSNGLAALGYQYINMDDTWMAGRDANGDLQWDPKKFPHGIPWLADQIHALGLKIGIYETPNTVTCSEIYRGVAANVGVGSLGHEARDAATFASWGIDYLKYDLCQGQTSSFAVMRDALRATGRPIFYSINPGNASPCTPTGLTTSACGLALPSTANMWRMAFDINASWASVTGIIGQNALLSFAAGPGHWNDPDMLEVGNPGLTDVQGRSHFSMWAVMAAPLILGNDLTHMSAYTLATISNAEVIAVDQDPLGKQGAPIGNGTTLQVWSKPLTGTHSYAVALFNSTNAAANMTVTWSSLGITSGSATVRDLWAAQDRGTVVTQYTANVPSDGVVMLKVVGQ